MLESGSRLGNYEILELIGVGGMGEVYKAKDTRLGRTVAVKVLPGRFARDAARRERFEREARAISSLNHPHICTVHDVGRHEGVDFIVMEYLEGETLAERLEKGALPLDQALEILVQIAGALDQAHRHDVVHRDVKPGNVMLTKPGVKLLDFGLAKFSQDESRVLVGSSAATEAKPLTEEGAILGTFQYMAPEQLEGSAVDARTDIFAFGAVIYEVLTGHKAFAGASRASLIGAIMNTDLPAITAHQPSMPLALDHVAQQCLMKDPNERWQTAGDLQRELSWIQKGGFSKSVASAPAPRRNRGEHTLWAAAVVLLLVALAFFATAWPDGSSANIEVRELSMTLPNDVQSFGEFNFAAPTVSPDGRHVVFNARDSSGTDKLWLRSMDSREGYPLPGTEGVSFRPFWSPDSQFVAFFAENELKKVSILGGPVQVICEASTEPFTQFGEGAWGNDEIILFTPTEAAVLYSVPAAGGEQQSRVTTLDASRFRTSRKPMVASLQTVVTSPMSRTKRAVTRFTSRRFLSL